jgi:hypothetical protein
MGYIQVPRCVASKGFDAPLRLMRGFSRCSEHAWHVPGEGFGGGGGFEDTPTQQLVSPLLLAFAPSVSGTKSLGAQYQRPPWDGVWPVLVSSYQPCCGPGAHLVGDV